ncbi:MAG: DUF58 domain-containing protein [Chloroflexales bacterium]|nr:DUF58 domain-containing protein [Chloroflexales bacterium]
MSGEGQCDQAQRNQSLVAYRLSFVAMKQSLQTRFARARIWITVNGRVGVKQPLALWLIPGLLIFSLLFGYRWLYFLVFCYGLVTLLCYLWVRHQGPQVRITRHLRSDWAMVGDEIQEQWELNNNSYLPLLWLEVNDASQIPGYQARRVTGCNAGETQRWITSAICTRRGVYALGPLHLRLGDPFGFFAYRWSAPASRKIVIYPPLVRLPPLMFPRGLRGGLARADLLQLFATPSVGGLREYHPGDLLSHIHWPTVARTGTLMVKEFDQERAGAIWIVLDLNRAVYPPAAEKEAPDAEDRTLSKDHRWRHADGEQRFEDGLELAVVLAASLAAQVLAAGRAVGFLTDDGQERVVVPGQGPRQLWQIMDKLVDVQASGAYALGNVIQRWQRQRGYTADPRAAVVLITPDYNSAWPGVLTAITLRGGALALLIDTVSFRTLADSTHPSPLEGLRLMLANLGIAAEIFSCTTTLPLLNPPRQYEELRVTPLGAFRRVKVLGDTRR